MWEETKECKSEGICREIFLKVGTDPILFQVDSLHFTDLMTKVVIKMNFNSDQNEIIKLKIFFFIDGVTCINEIGTKDILLDYSQKELINLSMRSMTNVKYGKQRNNIVSTQGILYLKIMHGKLKCIRNINFGFMN